MRSEIVNFIEAGEMDSGLLVAANYDACLKILFEPLLTVKLLQSTPNATANATLDCIVALRHGDDRRMHGQVLLEGEFYDINGVIGVPLSLRRSEWRVGTYLPLTPEISRLREVNARITGLYAPRLHASNRRPGTQ